MIEKGTRVVYDLVIFALSRFVRLQYSIGNEVGLHCCLLDPAHTLVTLHTPFPILKSNKTR